jgi:hypothetical protein
MENKSLSTNLKVREHLQDKGLDGMIILKFALWKYGVRVWT